MSFHGMSSSITISPDLSAKVIEIARARDVEPEDLIRVAIAGLSGSICLYALDDKIGFGKYADETVETIIRCDPRYVIWATQNTSRFHLGRAAQELAAQELLESVVGSVQ